MNTNVLISNMKSIIKGISWMTDNRMNVSMFEKFLGLSIITLSSLALIVTIEFILNIF